MKIKHRRVTNENPFKSAMLFNKSTLDSSELKRRKFRIAPEETELFMPNLQQFKKSTVPKKISLKKQKAAESVSSLLAFLEGVQS